MATVYVYNMYMYIAPRVMHFSVFILYISSGCLYKDSYSGVWTYNLGNCLLNLQKKEILSRIREKLAELQSTPLNM